MEGRFPIWILVLLGGVFLAVFVFPWGTVVYQQPTVQIQGHYAPLDVMDDGADLGAGPFADLRLTESLIPAHLGRLTPDRADLVYLHESSSRTASVTYRTGWADTEDRSVAFLSVPESEGARVLVGLDASSDPDAARTAACAAGAVEGEHDGVHFARIEVAAGDGLWIEDAHGELRVLLVPRFIGASRSIGGATLAVLPGPDGGPETWLLPGADALAGCHGACLEQAAGAAGAVRLEDVGPEMEELLRREPGLEGPVTGELTLVRQREAWVRVGSSEPRPVLPGGSDDSLFGVAGEQVSVFRRSPAGRAEPITGVGEFLHGAKRARTAVQGGMLDLKVGRASSDSPSVHVFDCADLEDCVVDGDDCRDKEAGRTVLAPDEWLIAGNGVHYVAELEPPSADMPEGALSLRLEVPPAGRMRIFPSLAASRFKAYNRLIPVGSCEEGPKTVLRGSTDERLIPPKVEPNLARHVRSGDEVVATLPMPRWTAEQHSEVEQGRTSVDLAELCVRPDGRLEITDHLAAEGFADASGHLSDAETFRLGGHVFRYADSAPMLEQLVPLIGFAFAVLFAALFVLKRLMGATGRGMRQPPSLVAATVSVAVLMVIGAQLQMHMSATDSLLGAPDYVHRHIAAGWAALILLVAAVEGCTQRAEDTDGWDRFYRVLLVVAVGLGLLLLHVIADATIWAIWGAEDDTVLAGEMVRTGVLVKCLWVVFFGFCFAGAAAWVRRYRLELSASQRARLGFGGMQDRWERRALRVRRTWLDVRVGELDRSPLMDPSPVVAAGFGHVSQRAHRLWAFGGRLWQRGVMHFFRLPVALGGRAELYAEHGFLEHVRSAEGPGRKLVSAIEWCVVGFWDLLFRRPSGEAGVRGGFGVGWLLLAMAVLLVGSASAFFLGSRALGGFDLKPSEFVAIFLGMGFGGMLAGFSEQQHTSPWFVPSRVLVWALLVEALLLAFYGGRGDLGPLMVIVPAVVFLLFAWSLGRGGEGGLSRPIKVGLSIFVGFLTIALALWAVDWLAHTIPADVVDTPLVGGSLARGIDRYETFTQAWYTTPGWWTTRGLWLAAGFYGDSEVYLSNLHSDLAYTALLQTYGTARTLVVLVLFAVLVGALFGLGESLVRAGQALRDDGAELADAPGVALGAKKRILAKTAQDSLRLRTIGYLAYFAGTYAMMEVVVHVGTCFNTWLQTGITLPWISSGGSAAGGFALLIFGTLGLAAGAFRLVPATDDAWAERRQLLLTAKEADRG